MRQRKGQSGGPLIVLGASATLGGLRYPANVDPVVSLTIPARRWGRRHMERISGTTNPIKDRQPGDVFTTETAGLSEAYPPAAHPAPRRRPVRPPHRARAQAHRRRRAAHARLQRFDPRPDAARRSRVGDHRAGDQRRRRRGDGSLARTAAGEPLRRRPARDAGADPDRRDVHLQGPVPRRRVLLVPPAHPRRLRAGDGPVRHDHRRALRTRRTGLLSTANSASRWTTCSSRTGTSRPSTAPARTTPRWAGSAT